MPRHNKINNNDSMKFKLGASIDDDEDDETGADETCSSAVSSETASSSFVSMLRKRVGFTRSTDEKDFRNGSLKANGFPKGRIHPSPSLATLNILDRQEIVLWKSPWRTVKYFFLEAAHRFYEALQWLWHHKLLLCVLVSLSFVPIGLYRTPGPHVELIQYLETRVKWCGYWVFLGILSSIGLGTGLHTFLLYLGPHIASVTLAAYECDSLDFPEPPYPEQILCPYGQDSTSVSAAAAVSLWAIMSKVRLEAFMWGAGTALGELPPYFMARASRLSGEEADDPEYREFLQYLEERERFENNGSRADEDWSTRAKIFVEKLVEKVGFFGILACASIPNPVFDLAGITCGHFLVPFWTFFGATLIGKAVVKMHIQKLFVVVAFSEHHFERCLQLLGSIPVLGELVQQPFTEFLKTQKRNLHRKPGDPVPVKSSWLSDVFGYLVMAMVVYFVLSIINSWAQAYHKRLWQQKKLTAATNGKHS